MKTGVQISSLKPVLTTEAQVREAFRRVAAMGSEAAQLQWVDPSVSVETVADAAEAAGMRCVSVQDFYEAVRAGKDYYIRLNGLTGGRWLCVSRVPDRLKSRPGLDAYAEELRALEAELEACGQSLCFHPVATDYTPIEGVCPVDYLLERLPAMPLCLDLYHLNRTGACLPDWIRAHAGRIVMAHFKDARDGRLVPAGQGETDWRGVAKACLDAGVEYGFVEQEQWEGDPFDRLREALDWLNAEIRAC